MIHYSTTGVQAGEPPSHDGRRQRSGELARLLREHAASISKIAAAWTRTSMERDDLTQEIAFALWRAMPAFRGESSERTFILRIAQNQAITHASKRRASPDPLTDEVESGAPDPERACAVAEQRRDLLAAIRRLPDAARQVITLALEGLSPAQGAEVLGISENNAAVRLSRARSALRREMRGEK
jgi:RNA polymerase sigma-70 factor (ECF subfamily)